MPWSTLAAFFVPTLGLMLAVHLATRRGAAADGTAAPSVRAISVGFGNTIQPASRTATALFGEAGLAIHLHHRQPECADPAQLATTLVEL